MTYSKWTDLPLPTRIKIAEIFDVKKVRSTHVAENRILDDGYEIKDIERILAPDTLRVYLNSQSYNPVELFDELVARVNKPEVVVTEETPAWIELTPLKQEEPKSLVKEVKIETITPPTPKKKGGRPKGSHNRPK